MEQFQITFYLKNSKIEEIIIDASSLTDAQNYLHQVLPEETSTYTFTSSKNQTPFTISFWEIQSILYKSL